MTNPTNTLSYSQLHAAFERVVAQHKGTAVYGLTALGPKLEDGIPWFEVQFAGSKNTKVAKAFVQALANELNIRVLLNRVVGSGDAWEVYGCLDFDPEFVQESAVRAYSSTEDGAEFMEDYGRPFMPAGAA